MKYPKMTNQFILDRLQMPEGKLNIVIDTDTYNELDDQFTLVYALKSQDRLNVEAIYAAPFYNEKSSGPKDGMEKSYEEILRILDKMKISSKNFVFKGSTHYFKDSNTPCESDAAKDLVKRAMNSEQPLYVVAIGAITNIASAIIIEPKIIEKIVLIWLGGNPLYWSDTDGFNLSQDITAARIILDCRVPIVHIPGIGVTSHLMITPSEVEQYVNNKSEIGCYLAKIFREYNSDPFPGWVKHLWDMAAVAYLINPDWVLTDIVHSPIITDQLTWSTDYSRHFMKNANFVYRECIFRDFFSKI